MKKLLFKTLYIFSPKEELAKKINFRDGINVITSSQTDGTDRGKSVIMRSLYHVLGADALFDDQWDNDSKTYILHFSIDDVVYYIYRYNNLFKLFDENKKIIFFTINRKELAENLKQIFDFAVELPNRENNRLEITPAAYNYILSFVDQDYYDGTHFNSFANLAQYSNYKENVLYYHLGAFDKNYFEIVKSLENLKIKQNDLEQQFKLADSLLGKTVAEIRGNTYSESLDLLKVEVEKTKEEYSEIVNNLSKLKNKLINLRNDKYELELDLNNLLDALKENEDNINDLNKHTCPFCKSKIEETISLKAEKYGSMDDIIFIINDVKKNIYSITKKITSCEENYKEVLHILESYQEKINLNSNHVSDVLKHNGYIKIQDELLQEMGTIKEQLREMQEKASVLTHEKRKYDSKKKEINKEYYNLLVSCKTRLGISEISNKKFEDIKYNFVAGGSNKPISTVIWYMALSKLKNKFNPTAIKFPLVFDSPNNAETDDNKKKEVFNFLLQNATDDNQMIISAIGFKKEDYDTEKDLKIIYLSNEKYHLLCNDDFKDNKKLLFDLTVI